MTQAAAFWSYSHDDNNHDFGRITQLAEQLKSEIEMISSIEFEIFVDRTSIRWGEEWEVRILEGLEQTTFFIPIYTPRYFKSSHCRSELLAAAGQADALSRADWILGLHYQEVEGLVSESEPDDLAVQLARRFQYENWQGNRFLEVESADHRRAVAALAVELVQKVRAQEDERERLHAEGRAHLDGSAHADGDEGSDEGEDLLLDKLAAGEEALARWNEIMPLWNGLLGDLTAAGSEATEDLQRADKAGKGFAGRLAASRRFAKKLDAVADEMEPIAAEFADSLVRINPMVLSLIEHFVERDALGELDDEERAASLEYFSSILTLVVSSADLSETMTDLIGTMETVVLSKDMRRPTSRLQRSLQALVDARSVIDQWGARIDSLDLGLTPVPTEPEVGVSSGAADGPLHEERTDEDDGSVPA